MDHIDISTEQKIKDAARTMFHKKGFVATRTRDIAEEANINLALLNYYFRSKKKLFDIIMLETIYRFIDKMSLLMNDANTSLEDKVTLITSNYIDFIIAEPNIPIFMLHEMRNSNNEILNKLPLIEVLKGSVFFKQFEEAVAVGKIIEENPFHFLMNLWSLIIFPFLGKPIITVINNMSEDDFVQFMQERKTLIPMWIKSMLKS